MNKHNEIINRLKREIFIITFFKWISIFFITTLLFMLGGCNAHKVTHKLEFSGIKHHIEIEKHHIEKVESHETHKETIKE